MWKVRIRIWLDSSLQKAKVWWGYLLHLVCISPRCLVTYFLNGLIIIIPLAVTLWVLIWVFNLVDGMLAPILDWGFHRHIVGLGTVVIITLVILIGYSGLRLGRRKAFTFLETQVIKIPVVGAIYGGTRQVVESFTTASTGKFLEVIFMEFPRKGVYTVGFVTSEVKDRDGKKILNVFIPTAPNPVGGFLLIVPESDVVHTSIPVSTALKYVISAGKVTREEIGDMLLQVSEREISERALKT